MALAEPGPLPPFLMDAPLDEDGLDDQLKVWAEVSHGMAPPEDEPPALHWQPEDDGAAEWAARHLVQAQREMRHLSLQAADYHQQIDAWFSRVARPVDRRIKFFGGHLERYGVDQRQSTGRKTVELVSATVKTTAQPDKAALADEAAVVAWARENLDAATRDAVVKVADPTVRISELAKVTKVVQVVDAWHAVLTCGCITVFRNMPSLEAGTGTECPECNQEALIGRLEVREAHQEVHDRAGRPVPGTTVQQGALTVKVVTHEG